MTASGSFVSALQVLLNFSGLGRNFPVKPLGLFIVQAIKSGFMSEIYLPFGRWFWGRQRALGAANFASVRRPRSVAPLSRNYPAETIAPAATAPSL
jgi:hypothetical protein